MTVEPPEAGPLLGCTEKIVAAAWYSNCHVATGVLLVGCGIRLKDTVPLVIGGETHCIRVVDIHKAGEDAPYPKRQKALVPRTMLAPLMATRVPPCSGPRAGTTDRIEGPM